jgi:hypothetical protein
LDELDDGEIPVKHTLPFKRLKVNLDHNNPVRRYIRGLIGCTSLPRLAAYIALLGHVLDEMKEDDSSLVKEVIKLKLSLEEDVMVLESWCGAAPFTIRRSVWLQQPGNKDKCSAK